MVETMHKTPRASGLSSNQMAALAYVLTWITGIVVYLMAEKTDKYARFHALQSIGLGIVLTGFWLLWNLVFMTMVFSTSFGMYAFLGLVSTLVWIAGVVAIVICAVMAYQGKNFKIPIIGNMVEKNA